MSNDTRNRECKGCAALLDKPAPNLREFFKWEVLLRDHLNRDHSAGPVIPTGATHSPCPDSDEHVKREDQT